MKTLEGIIIPILKNKSWKKNLKTLSLREKDFENGRTVKYRL